jgi:hypothetical protein
MLNSGIFVTRPLRGEYHSSFLYWVLASDVFEFENILAQIAVAPVLLLCMFGGLARMAVKGATVTGMGNGTWSRAIQKQKRRLAESRLTVAVRRVETLSKSIWNSSRTAHALWFVGVAVLIWFSVRTPPPGWSVAVLGMAALVLTIREMPYAYKCLWLFLALGFLIVELRAIRKDRSENQTAQAEARRHEDDRFAEILARNQREFAATMERSEAIVRKSEEIASFASGGRTFPKVFPAVVKQADGKNTIGFYLNKQGAYPLYTLRVNVMRPYRSTEPNQIHGTGALFKLDEYNTSTTYPLYFLPLPSENVAYYSASMSARNGQWEEGIDARRVGPKNVFPMGYFWSVHPRHHAGQKIVDLADAGFPDSVRNAPIYPLNASSLPYDPEPTK